jgi:hypothetical protein
MPRRTNRSMRATGATARMKDALRRIEEQNFFLFIVPPSSLLFPPPRQTQPLDTSRL